MPLSEIKIRGGADLLFSKSIHYIGIVVRTEIDIENKA